MRKPMSRCPICGRPSSAENQPFCSPRCKEVDLGRWLTGVYRIPGPEAGLDDDPPPAPEAA
ncbi:DNA gyrase inhibitor YacG [Rhodopila sp.]|uniref:DNA gyrase inhibitor YacG n=1 Tax=Rhodopila sp. TaxID=2480087 RepID=UPI002CC3D35B|nr:DNA gyrase inhibitor YacG [Rhodopila sp.]HVZ09878.1 DNA gyrase inhibitor YacG [Rhodopila sp.]